MTNKDAISRLALLAMETQRKIDAVNRKKSWRDSEKVMTVAMFKKDMQAINIAISELKAIEVQFDLNKDTKRIM